MGTWKDNNTLIKYSKLTEGTWNLIENKEDFNRMKFFFQREALGEDWIEYFSLPDSKKKYNPFYNMIIGDDILYDKLDEFSKKFPKDDVRDVVYAFIEDFIKKNSNIENEKLKWYKELLKYINNYIRLERRIK